MTCFLIILRLGIKKDNTEISYRKFYKEKIIPSFIKEIFPNLNFLNNIDDTNKKIIKQEYLSSNFDKISIQRFEVNDFLVGYMDNNSYIKIANLRLENKATKQAYLTIFNGLFVYTTLSTSIDTSIKICLNQNFSIDNKQYFEMDNSFFENYFDIYTDNKMISLKILTHDVMEQLVNFYEKYNIPFEIILNNKKLYLRFFTKDFFVPKKIDGTINNNELFEYYCILNFITDVTTKINTIVNEKNL